MSSLSCCLSALVRIISEESCWRIKNSQTNFHFTQNKLELCRNNFIAYEFKARRLLKIYIIFNNSLSVSWKLYEILINWIRLLRTEYMWRVFAHMWCERMLSTRGICWNFAVDFVSLFHKCANWQTETLSLSKFKLCFFLLWFCYMCCC